MSSVTGNVTEKGSVTENAMDDLDNGAHEYFTNFKQQKRRLPPLLDHFNLKDFKLLFKCWAAAWVMTLLIFINPSLRAIGQAVFFGVVVIFIGPPSGVVMVNIMVSMTLVLGVCLGWAYGVITMKAALATRPAADLQRQLQNLQKSSQAQAQNTGQASGQTKWVQIDIFNGAMLDSRVTITYFCMIGLFIYIMARVRMAAPKLALVQIFSMVVSDLFLTIAPLLPSFVGTLPKSLIYPAGIATGINVACNILFFPQSTSYLVLDNMQDILKPMNGFLGACLLHYQDPSGLLDLNRLKSTKATLIKSYQTIESNLGLLALDVSTCVWSAGDIKSLYDPIRAVLGALAAMLQDHIMRLELFEKENKMSATAERIQQHTGEKPESGDWHFLQAFELRKQLPQFTSNDRRARGMNEFYRCSRHLNVTVQESIHAILEALREYNTNRWFGRLSAAQIEALKSSHVQTLAQLRQHRKECSDKVARVIWEFHQGKVTEKQMGTEDAFTEEITNNNVLILVLEERLQALAQATETLLDRIVQLEGQRTRTRVWFPGSFKDIVPWALEKDENSNYDGMALKTTVTVEPSRKSKWSRKGKSGKSEGKDVPNSAKTIIAAMNVSGTPRSSYSRSLVGIWSWIGNNDGIYALKLVFITLALATLAVTKETAGFFYQQKGLWGLIMSQTGLMPYTADFLYGMMCKFIGTITGGVLGMLAWYIGAGNGPGNAYGLSSIMAVVIVIAMWLRLFASPALLQGIIMGAATAYLVVSYSWIDTHIPSYGNPGVGYAVFWRRLLLVLIGFGASSIVQLLPRPPSATRFYRRSLATALDTIKEQYALLGACRDTKPDDFEEVVQERALGLGQSLIQLQPQIQLTRFELSTSNMDTATLDRACQLCITLNHSVAQIMTKSMRLPDNFRARWFRATGVLEDRIVADVMALVTLAQHALINGEPLPTIIPGPLMERSLTLMKEKFKKEQLDMTNYEEAMFADPAVRKYVAATAAFVHFLSALDELILLLKRSLGETACFTPDIEAR